MNRSLGGSAGSPGRRRVIAAALMAIASVALGAALVGVQMAQAPIGDLASISAGLGSGGIVSLDLDGSTLIATNGSGGRIRIEGVVAEQIQAVVAAIPAGGARPSVTINVPTGNTAGDRLAIGLAPLFGLGVLIVGWMMLLRIFRH